MQEKENSGPSVPSPGGKKAGEKYKTDGGKTKSNAIEVPSISLPKGGGAIKGIDQKFSVNAVNGTAALSIPLPVAKARGAAPALSLSYNSGGGNGIFGLGWNLNLPSIKRKTDKELPQYYDYIESDTYLLSEAEDLVPEYRRNDGSVNPADRGKFVMNGDKFEYLEDTSVSGYIIRFYKPRIEGLFARIERWTDTGSGSVKWRVISKDNLITLYGWSDDTRIADPADASRIFEWLPEMVMDDKGNCAVYKYKAEDAAGFDPALPHNRNRYDGSGITYTNRYLDKILYGNATPYLYGSPEPAESDFMFQTVLDYGQYRTVEPYDAYTSWAFRPDAFSEYKPGFEIRTTRLCKRVLLFHYFTGAFPGNFALVQSLDFTYGNNSNEGFTFLNAVTSTGYIKLTSSTYSSKSLPPMQFTYQPRVWSKEVQEVSAGNLLHAPSGLSAPYSFTDLYNEGLSGILSEQANGWYYKRNLGEGNFEAARQVSPKPSFSGLNGSLQLLDLDGDGTKQLVNFNGSPQGYFEINDDDEWQPFHNFRHLPNISMRDPNARLIDLNGDGKTELLITEDEVFTWYESDGREGFSNYHRSPKFIDEEAGPKVIFAEGLQTIHLADMSGDGLVDIVRIRNGEVCYWPNLGYGHFGKKVSMSNAPVLDSDADFDPAHVQLSDIDGSGTPDLIYLGKNKFTCWLNLSGNGYYHIPFEIEAFPSVHDSVSITVADLLGTGLSCIVWSSSLQRDAEAPLRYIDLMSSKKPHILIKHVNNLGTEVELEYTPSTNYYIKDKQAGMPWATKLHFPVHCISRVITTDKVTGHVFASTYSYHHGYYDHAEKEFRGFGRVDQTDTERTENWTTQLIGGTNYLSDATLNQAPVLTRSWFHTGAYLRDKKILEQFKTEYWYEELGRFKQSIITHPERSLPDALILPDGLNAANAVYVSNISALEKRQALRSCKSMPLRTEVFALDAPLLTPTAPQLEMQLTPYSVGTHNCMIEMLQPRGQNKYAIFCVKESEALTYNYERNTADPRIAHTLNLELDIYGNVLKSASVVYPRVTPDMALPQETRDAQDITYITVTQNDFTNDVSGANSFRLRLPCESRTFEITGLGKSSPGGYPYYVVADFNNVTGTATSIPYEQLVPGAGKKKRLIEHMQSLYYADSLAGPLALGALESIGLPYESYQHAYTDTLVTDIFTDPAGPGNVPPAFVRVTGAHLSAGKFYQPPATTDWWVRSGTIQYRKSGEGSDANARLRFYTPVSFTDPFGTITTVEYDARSLFIEKTTDVLLNVSEVKTFDYRTLSPVKIQDVNHNVSEVLLDELGLPKAMALKGKDTGTEGDSLSGLTPQTMGAESSAIAAYFTLANAVPTDSASLATAAAGLISQATARYVYDLSVQPTVVSTIVREEHFALVGAGPLQLGFEYSGGSGQVVMKKMQAEAGPATQVTDNGNGTVSISAIANTSPSLRWIGNGRTVVNNKGNTVMQYEPYFSVTARYETQEELVTQGVSPLLRYDAPGRLIRTDFPDGTFSKTEFDGWKQVSFDQNDTVLNSQWYNDRDATPNAAKLNAAGKNVAREQAAASQTILHNNTPKIMHFDTLGRPVTEQETDGSNVYYTHLFLDVENNLRMVRDARSIDTMQYKYDMLGNMVFQQSADSGKRWLMVNALGSPLHTWDQRNHELQFDYDALHRPSQVKVLGGDGAVTLNNIVEKYIYGEAAGTPEAFNLRGKIYQHYDTAGMEQTAEYDFKGNALSKERWLTINYKDTVDWSVTSGKLEGNSYLISTFFDAMNRIREQTAPDGSIITPAYSARGVLVSENVSHVSLGDMNPMTNIEYDAKGQRTRVDFESGATTIYTYDQETYRLLRLHTMDSGGGTLQNLSFTYDPIGNITHKLDSNIPDIFYANQQVRPAQTYTYDALYRLTAATGREKIASATFGATDNWHDNPFIMQHGPNDPMPMQNYTQEYAYDEVGNIMHFWHTAASGSYTRDYAYDGGSNRLIQTDVDQPGANYTYNYHPEHGFFTELPHLPVLKWNFKEEIWETSQQVATLPAVPETTWYQYDSKGRRLRKITENQAPVGPGSPKNMRVYIEGYEYYEDFVSGDQTRSLSLMDDGRRFVTYDDSSAYGQFIRYQHPNHQNSTTLETDENTEVISYEEFHPFGTTSYKATRNTIPYASRYRYTGMERDDETGLNYHNARYYIPWLCRWMSADPIGIGDGVNVFAYCHNNPIVNSDFEGTQVTPQVAGNSMINSVQSGLKQGFTFNGVGSISASAAFNLRITFGSKGKANVNIGFSTSLKAYGAIPGVVAGQASLNFSSMFTNGGISSAYGNRGRMRSEMIVSPVLNVGIDRPNTTPTAVSYLHNNATTSLTNPIKYSITLAHNRHYTSDGRSQRTGTIGTRLGGFSFNLLEDVGGFPGSDGLDQYWTGSGNANVDAPWGARYTIGTDTHTGKSLNDSKIKPDYGDKVVGGTVRTPGKHHGKPFYWANQEQFDEADGVPLGTNESLNNAQTFFQMTTASGTSLRMTTTGPLNFWSQNAIHDLLPKNFHHFKPADTENRWEISTGQQFSNDYELFNR